MQQTDKLIYITDFSRDPDFRLKEDGDFSAEEFRDEYVIPQLDKLQKGEKLTINLDGTHGISPWFLEEVFGGSVRKKYLDKEWAKKIEIISETVPEYRDVSIHYIKEALGQNQ
ncbi:MAG: STAS-like domain-containing protein [Alphaproteobacteria bacterium]|nr:STAS-like domain-containing protein [Alphaproteobacteria bacterium]